MKKTIRTYLFTILIFLIPFVTISFILAILSYFMQTNAFAVEIIIQIISYLCLIIAALFFTSQIQSRRLTHCFIMSLFYFLCSLLIHLGNLHYLHLLLKSLIFMIIGLYKEIRNRRIA